MIKNLISFLISAIKIIFLLGFLIGIHETGHFLIAKLFTDLYKTQFGYRFRITVFHLCNLVKLIGSLRGKPLTKIYKL